MALFSLEFAPSAEKQVRKLTGKPRVRVAATLEALREQPRPVGSVKIEGWADHYRIRVGEYRIIYQIEDARLIVLVIRIGHRREVYRGF